MDGGIIFYQLDPLTGEQLNRNVLHHLDPDTDKELFKEKRGTFDMVGCSSDILCGDGERVFLKHLAFNRNGEESATTSPHLYSVTGMLDEEWFVRAYWRYGENHGAGWAQAGGHLPFGRIMCVDEDRIFAYGRESVEGGRTGHQTDTYHLYSCDKKPAPPPPPTPQQQKAKRRGKKQPKPKPVPPARFWSKKNPITVRAMAAGRDRIVVAGPADIGRKGAHLSFINPGKAEAAFKGNEDIFLQLIDKQDGRKTFELKIDDYPAFDGLSIVPGRIFLSGRDGTLTCFGG